jgi:copper chaperone NosL
MVVLLGLAASVACGVRADGPPEIQVDRTACSHCGMLVSEPAYAAAYRTPGSDARVFDDIGCLLEAARRESTAGLIRFWFHDAASAAWIEGETAVFVASPALRTPMGGGLIAYRDRTAAREAAARHRGRVVDSLNDLLQSRELGGHGASDPAR